MTCSGCETSLIDNRSLNYHISNLTIILKFRSVLVDPFIDILVIDFLLEFSLLHLVHCLFSYFVEEMNY